MALVKRLVKGSPVSAAEYDAVVEQVETNKESIEVLNGQFNESEVTLSFTNLAAATSYWTAQDGAGNTPTDGVLIYIEDVKEDYKWLASDAAKAVATGRNFKEVLNTFDATNEFDAGSMKATADEIDAKITLKSSDNIDDADQTKLAEISVVKAEQVKRINAVNKIALETNLLKTVNLIDGKKANSDGSITNFGTYFYSEPIPITAGLRYATFISNGVTPIMNFYSSNLPSTSTLVRHRQSLEPTAPLAGDAGNNPSNDVDATHVVISALITSKNDLIVQQLDSGFPTLGDDTFIYQDLYKKSETYNKTEVDNKDTVLDNKIDTEVSTLETTIETTKNDLEVEIEKIAEETNILVKYGIVEGSRVDVAGNVINDASFFRTNVVPTTSFERFACISDNTGLEITFSFYSSSVTTPANFISQTSGQEASVPSGTTHFIAYANNAIKLSLIIQKLDGNLYPKLVQDTFKLNALKKVPEFYAEQTNILTKNGVTLVDKSRTDNSGNILGDGSYFRTEPYPVTVGYRYAAVSDNLGINARFAFYSDLPASASTFVGSIIQGYEATAPETSRYMIFAGNLSNKNTYILQQLDLTAFPTLGERTVDLVDTYDKEYLDTNFAKARWYPNTFELNVNYQVSDTRIYVVDENEVLYGSNARTIVKATQSDLSDQITVCTLDTANSVLWSLVKVSNTKFVGYVVNPITPSAEGFYIFTNADTNSWTQTKAIGNETTTFSKMLSGFPDPKFQNFFRIPSNGYIFACSYSSPTGKDGNPNPVNPAPVNIYRSIDDGTTWTIVYTHPSTLNTHIHAIEYDEYRDRVWGLVGDANLGGTPRIIYSNNYGTTWNTVTNKKGVEQQYMFTSIIPTRRYVLFGKDQQPAGFSKWQPKSDIKDAAVFSEDIEIDFYKTPVTGDGGQNFGFARRGAVDITNYPYNIVVPISHTASYSKSGFFLSPNFRDWYMLNFEDDPINNPHPIAVSGILSDGTVIGWGGGGGSDRYFTFQFPNWIEN